jgi:hypothetical protein
VCTISFPVVLFDNSHFRLHLAINPIYQYIAELARVLISSIAAIKLAGDRWYSGRALTIEQMGGKTNMADDKMKNDDLQRNMGAGQKDKNIGQQSPGHSGQTGQQAGQHAGGQQSGGQFGGQKATRNVDDDEDDIGAGRPGQSGSQNRGGQNR